MRVSVSRDDIMQTFKNPSNLIQKVEILVAEKNLHLVSIDGFSGSGKSYLSKVIVESNSYSYIDIDGDYLVANNGRYIDFIKYEKLKSDIFNFISNEDKVVIDGICILKVLERIGFKPDIKIYVKGIHNNQWRDGKHRDYATSVEDALFNIRVKNQQFENDAAYIEGREPKLIDLLEENMTHETMRYHYSYRPDITADLIYENKWLPIQLRGAFSR